MVIAVHLVVEVQPCGFLRCGGFGVAIQFVLQLRDCCSAKLDFLAQKANDKSTSQTADGKLKLKNKKPATVVLNALCEC
jgi:hypothetical protein